MASIKQLRYALSVEKHLHFSKAAEECAVSQSALSSALSELERSLGVVLFERGSKRILVTRAGADILAKAREIECKMAELENLSNTNRAILSCPMSLGFTSSICPVLLSMVLPALRLKHPCFQFNIVEDQASVLLEKIRVGGLDAAVIALPYKIDGLLSFEFWQEDFYWIAHSDDVDTNQHEIAAEDIQLSRLMRLKGQDCLNEQIRNLLPGSFHGAVNQMNEPEISSLNTLVELVVGKVGTAVLPKIVVGQLVQTGRPIHVMRLKAQTPQYRLAFVIRAGYTGLDNIEALIAIFRSELSQRYQDGAYNGV